MINNNVFGLIKGEKGDTGKGLEIKKYYDSVEAMNADYSNADIAVGDSVAIKNTLDLYVKGNSFFEKVGTLKGENGADGQDGATPEIGENGNWWIVDKDTGKPSRGATGATGATGADGATPEIGENGNWYINGEDTGKPSRGATGATGAGVPAGGNAGQVLAKITDADNDTAWVDAPTGGGSSGNSLQTTKTTLKPQWFETTFNGRGGDDEGNITAFSPRYIWTDGRNTYFSAAREHYVLNKETRTWEPKTWNCSEDIVFTEDDIWTDGENIYKGQNYVLDAPTSTWERITLENSNMMLGGARCIFTIGDSIYYSDNYDQRRFSPVIRAWTEIKFRGELSLEQLPLFGSDVWTDGDKVYYSRNDTHYVYNQDRGWWEPKIWYGLDTFYGSDVWTDGENIYYHNGDIRRVLNRETDTWEYSDLSYGGEGVWTDGENIYYWEQNVLSLNPQTVSAKPLLKR